MNKKCTLNHVLITVFLLAALLLNLKFAFADGEIFNAAGEDAFSYQLSSYLGESGWVIKTGYYEYAPTVMKVRGDDDTVHMWYCGGGGSAFGDSIYYTKSDNYGQWGTWTAPVEVIRPSNNNSYLDYGHACDPSVTWFGGYYYVMYTGTPDWRLNGGNCITGGETGCDGRIFVARVPDSALADKSQYQKLVNYGECASPGCFQWREFWSGPEFPPVPIVRYEIGSVWRRAGTGVTGTTTQQTQYYGIGQPSQLSVLNLHIWFTDVSAAVDGSVGVWSRNYQDIANPYLLQDYSTYQQRISNSNNHVNYDILFDSTTYRFMCTMSAEPNQRPRVHMAHKSGPLIPAIGPHIISNNLEHQPGNTQILQKAESDAHNSGFLRDQWGYLARMPGHLGGTSYGWVYYGTNKSGPVGSWDINRVPFLIE